MKDDKQMNLSTIISSGNFNEMPMLRSILSEFFNNLRVSLAKHLSHNLEVRNETIVPIDSSDYINDSKENSQFIAVEYKFNGWNAGPFLVFIQKNTIYKMIEVLLGGKKLEHSIDVQNRSFSKIEQNIINTILEVISSDLHNAFLAADSAIKIIKKSLFYSGDECSDIKSGMSFLARADIELKEISGRIELLIPYETLLPMKSSLIKTFSNKKLVQQDSWRTHMINSLSDIELELTVEVDTTQTIDDVSKMKVGDTLVTHKTSSEAFEIRVNGMKFFDCKIGKVSDKLAIEIV